jgi:hypothetical protein
MAAASPKRLNDDFFWFVVNPEQHVWVLDQKRVDFHWRAKQNPWHTLVSALPGWAARLQRQPDDSNLVTRKSAIAALRGQVRDGSDQGQVKHDSRNTYDKDLERLIELGILRRRSTGFYEVSKEHAGAAIFFVDNELPRILESSRGHSLEEAIRHAARDLRAKVDALVDKSPLAVSRLVEPYVPTQGPQGRQTPAYITAFLLWRFAATQLEDWKARGSHWLEPAEARLADIKDFAKQWGLRKGSQGLQEFVDLGRACGLFRDAKRGVLAYFPGFAPVVNRLMWELLPATTTTVRQALPIARTIHGGMAGAFERGGLSFWVAEQWRKHLGWKYVPSGRNPDRNLPGTFIDQGKSIEGGTLAAVACPTHLMIGSTNTAANFEAAPAASQEEHWWHQVMHRSEAILAERPEWGAFVFPASPAIGNPDTRMEATKWRPDEGDRMYFDLVASSIEHEYLPSAIVFVEGLRDQGRALDHFHRLEMRVVTMHDETRMTCDLLKENGKWVPQLWLPLPPNPRTDFEANRFREVIVAARSSELRKRYVEELSKAFPEEWKRRKQEIGQPVVRDKRGRVLRPSRTGPAEPSSREGTVGASSGKPAVADEAKGEKAVFSRSISGSISEENP